MEPYFYGLVSLISLKNVCPYHLDHSGINDTDCFLNENHIKIVQYPECRQLVIWLQADGGLYHGMVFGDQVSEDAICRKNTSEMLKGRIQIILDTLPIEP